MASPVRQALTDLRARRSASTEGRLAEFIPQLGLADPRLFGIAPVTIDGEVHEAGDARAAFTIQSMSKPFACGAVLETCGPERVLRHVGVTPTGESFTAIIPGEANHRPFNPMMNAGAITASAVLPGAGMAARAGEDGGAVLAPRPPGAERDWLARRGHGVAVIEVQGPLPFGSAERLVRRIPARAATSREVIAEFRRATSGDAAEGALLLGAVRSAADAPATLTFTGLVADRAPLQAALGGRRKRLGSIGPGHSIGEMALVDGPRRSADVFADEPIACYGLSVARLRGLAAENPTLVNKILGNLLRTPAHRLCTANEEIRQLE